MTKHEREQLRLALRAARTTRHHAYEAALAASGDLAVTLQRLHLEACVIESEILQTLLTHPESSSQEPNPNV